MKNYALCVILLCTLPAFATISHQQSPVYQWNSSASSTCSANFGSTSNAHDLFVVWTFWKTSSSPNQLTAQVSDLTTFGNTFVSAVGPTLQSASNTYAQIFYAANITTVTGQKDTLTVTYSGSAVSSGCVFVEYQGADPSNPLDSVSAGYSTSGNPTNLLDSGTTAPANANLLVFAGGNTDAGVVSAGSSFTLIQSNAGSITEEFINSPTQNNTLQRATAGSAGMNSNWVMLMAIFRDASWTVAGGWSPARPPDVVNAAQYPGVDICVQAQNAATGNPNATILMPISGTMACSVDPTGAASTSPITSAPVFQGKLKLVTVGGSPAQLNMDTPWVFFNSSMTLDAGSVQFIITQNFRNNWSGQRCWTAGTADTTDFGACANGGLGGSGGSFSIANNTPTGTSCALVTYPGSTKPYEIRGGEIISITGASDLRNNGIFRVIPVNDGTCTGTSGPTATQFYIWAPSAQNCTGSSGSSGCGSSVTLAAQTAMFYMGPRTFDDPNNTGGSCITLPGGTSYGSGGEKCSTYGVKLLNLGELDGWGYGLEGIDNSQCMEQCAINSYGSRTIYRTSMLTYGQWSPVSQNNAAIQHFEDYCNNGNNNNVNFYCVTSPSGSYLYGTFHVGIWLRDTWNHGSVQDATINESAYAGIMLDGMGGNLSGSSIKGIHFQNGGDANPPTEGNYGGSLANIAIGAQASASSVYIEQIEGNKDAGVAANILISGSNAPPLNLPAWQASSNSGSCSGPPSVCFTYPVYAAIFPTTGNTGCGGSGCVFEVSVPGGSGSSHPSWSSTSPGTCVSEGTGLVTWCNVGSSLPNSTGPGGNVVKAVQITNNKGDTPTIFNGGTNNKWTDASIAEYSYQNDSGSIYECASESEHPCRIDQGINLNAISPLPASGINSPGSNITVSGGISTGNGTPGLFFQDGGQKSSTSGTSPNLQVHRQVINDTKALSTTSNTNTTLLSLNVGNGQAAGVILRYVIIAKSATDTCVLNGVVTAVAETNSSGASKGFIGTSTGTDQSSVCTGSDGLSATFSITNANPAVVSVKPIWSTVVPTSVYAVYNYDDLSDVSTTP